MRRVDGLRPLLQASGFPLDRVVIEVTAHMSVSDYTPVIAAREQLRALGIRLAVDDAGGLRLPQTHLGLGARHDQD
jgi:EAL domain-containing protein (putative c-di-GMP-specific phosphodiesterase class I)